MIKEAMQYLADLAKSSIGVTFHSVDKIPHKVFLRHGDELREVDLPPEDRAYSVHSLSDMIDVLRKRVGAGGSIVFVGADKVVGYFDESTRRESVEFSLPPSDRWNAISMLQKRVKMTAPELARWLRQDLGVADQVQSLLSSLSSVTFSRTQSATQQQSVGRESLGRSVEMAAAGASAIDPTFTVTIPVWEAPGLAPFMAAIQVGIDFVMEESCLTLKAMPDEIRRAYNAARLQLRDALRLSLPDVTVACGD